MRIARLVGLVAVMASALIATTGVSSASATETTLCKAAVSSPYCAEENRYPASTSLKAATASKFTISNEILNVKCNSNLEASTGAKTGNPLPVTISSWNFTNCTFGCTVSFKELPSGSINWGTGNNGALSLASGGGSPQLHVYCFGFIECDWSFPNPTVEGGSPPQLVIPTTELKVVSGKSCPSKATLENASFAVSAPSPMYVANGLSGAEHVRLCKASESPRCSGTSIIMPGSAFNAESSNLKIGEYHGWDISCKATTLNAETQVLGAEPFPLKVNSLGLNQCSMGGIGTCSTAVTNGSPGASIYPASGGGQATLQLQSEWEFKCGPGYLPELVTCKFGFEAAPGTIVSKKSPTEVVWGEMPLHLISGPCEGNKLTANFKVNSLGLFYVI